MDEEDRLKQLDEVTHRLAVQSQDIGHLGGYEQLTSLTSQPLQNLWQHVPLTYLSNLQYVAFNHQVHEIAEPTGPSLMVALKGQRESAAEHHGLILSPC